MTFDESKAKVDQLVQLFNFYFVLLRRTQVEIGERIAEMANEHGARAIPVLDDAIKQMRAATLEFQEAPTQLKM